MFDSFFEVRMIDTFEECFVNFESGGPHLKGSLLSKVAADDNDRFVDDLGFAGLWIISEEKLYVTIDDLGCDYLCELFFGKRLSHGCDLWFKL